MVFYLLPWSRHQSSVSLAGEGWEGSRFDVLNPLRKELIKNFGVRTSSLAPAWRRYRGRFWDELSLWALPSKVQKHIEERGLVPSPLFGFLGAGDLVPRYDLHWKTKYEGRSLRDFWRDHLKSLFRSLFEGALLIDLLSYEDRKVFTFPESSLRVVFEYYRRDRRVINTLPHRAYTLRYMVEKGVGLEDLERINFLDYRVKEVREEGKVLKVVLQSEGRYV